MTALSSIFRPIAVPLAILALALSACGDQGGAAAGKTVPVNPVLTDVVMGSPTATVTVLEYASLTCPHCRDFWKQDFPRLKTNYIDTGKVKYIYRDLPTDAVLAPMLVAVSRCKGAGPYYELVDDIFSNFTELQEAAAKGEAGPLLVAIGARHGANADEIRACLTHKGIQDALQKSVQDATSRGAKNTPTLFINDKLIEDHSYDKLAAAIDALLGGAPAPTETPTAPAAPPVH